MGTEKADAVRLELRSRLLDAYGSIENAAAGLDMPYKTLYRALTMKGKDRTATINIDLVITIVDHLESKFNGDDFPTFFAYATRNVS